MNGALPPSSIDTFLTVPAHCCISSLPVRVEPVKLSLRTVGFEVSSPPMATASPVTTLKTPAGMPARSARTARARAERGVCGAGFRTTVQPAARAGDTLRVTMAFGKFQGVMAAHTPMGSRRTWIRLSVVVAGMVSP
jgi:hypothetical protein